MKFVTLDKQTGTDMKYILLILSAIIICSCQHNTTSTVYDAGISQELAQQRKANIHNLEYSLKFNIPLQKDSAVMGEIGISFNMEY